MTSQSSEIFPFGNLGGVPLTEEEQANARQRDFGPIGSKITKVANDDSEGSKEYVYAWVTDFMKEDNSFAAGDQHRRGFVPALARTPEMWETVAQRFPDAPLNTGKERERRRTSQTFDNWQPSPDLLTRRLSETLVEADPDTSLMSVSGCSPSSGTSSEPSITEQPIKISKSSNDADMREFAMRYGYVGRVKPSLLYRPRKGKYFKAF